MRSLTKTAGCVPTIPILELTCPSLNAFILVPSFHALTNCPFSIPFVLTFMHRMGGVGGTPKFKPSNLPTFQPCLDRQLTPAGSQKQSARAAGTKRRNPATASREHTFC